MCVGVILYANYVLSLCKIKCFTDFMLHDDGDVNSSFPGLHLFLAPTTYEVMRFLVLYRPKYNTTNPT